MLKVRKQFCLRKHDTFISGRYKNGACILCTRVKSLNIYKVKPEQLLAWKKNNPEKVNKIRDLWRKNNPENTKKIGRTWAWKKYGILNLDGSQFTQIDFDRLYQIQQGKCKICKVHQSELKQSLVVDHDHKTGFVRGLLCQKHNKGLGHFNDVLLLEETIIYLKNSRGI